MQNYFFTATTDAHHQLTRLFDFVWPTAAAMWNLRWQVAGFLQVIPDASVEQLTARFMEGANIGGANLKRACIDHSWEEQQQSFARLLLVNSIAVFEGWLHEILVPLGDRKRKRTLVTALQFPDSTAEDGKGACWAISELRANQSAVLKNSFYSELSSGKNFALLKLDAMLLCYRYFKELRNCQSHTGEIANAKTVVAFNNFTAVATSAQLGVSEVPHHFPVIDGSKIALSLRGVVGLSHLILKLIASIDAELCCSEISETAFGQKWRLRHPHQISVSTSLAKRDERVSRLVKKAGFPKPSSVSQLATWLKDQQFIDY